MEETHNGVSLPDKITKERKKEKKKTTMSGVRAKCIFIKTVNVTAVWTMLHTYTVVVKDTFHVPSHFK